MSNTPSPQISFLGLVHNVEKLREQVTKLGIRDGDSLPNNITSHSPSVPQGQNLESLSSKHNKLAYERENDLVASELESVNLFPKQSFSSSGSSLSFKERQLFIEPKNSNSTSGHETARKLNIPKLKFKVRNDSEKENFEDENDLVLSLQSQKQIPEVGCGSAVEYNQFSMLSQLASGNQKLNVSNNMISSPVSPEVEESNVFSPLAQLANKHSVKSQSLDKSNNFSSLSQLSTKIQSSLPCDNITSLTQLTKKPTYAPEVIHQEGCTSLFEIRKLTEVDSTSQIQYRNKNFSESLKKQLSRESTDISPSDLSEKCSFQSVEQETSEGSGSFSSLSQLANQHSKKLKTLSFKGDNKFSSLTELGNKYASRVKEHVNEVKFSSLTDLENGHTDNSVLSLTDLALRNLNLSDGTKVIPNENINKQELGSLSASSNETIDLTSCLLSSPSQSTKNAVPQKNMQHLKKCESLVKSRSKCFNFENEDQISKNCFESSVMNSSEALQNKSLHVSSHLGESGNDETEDNWVIDLTSALQSPSSKVSQPEIKSKDKPKVSFSNVIDVECSINLLLEDPNDFILDFKESSAILEKDLTKFRKPSTSFGKIICKKWKSLSKPYIISRKLSYGKLVHFTFNTPSPDDVIKSHLRRQ